MKTFSAIVGLAFRIGVILLTIEAIRVGQDLRNQMKMQNNAAPQAHR